MAAVTSPNDLSGLHAWYDASQLGLANGASVSSWTDLGPAGTRHLVQATGANQMTVVTNLQNSLAGVRGDGTNDYMKATIASDVTFTHIAVIKKRSAPGGTAQWATSFYDFDGGGTPMDFGTYSPADATGFTIYPYTNAYTPTAAGGTATNAQIIGWRSNSTTSLEYFHTGARQGVFDPAGAIVGTGIVDFAIGARGNGAEPGDYDHFEHIIYDRALTDHEWRRVAQYLAIKWNVTGPALSPWVSTTGTEFGTSFGADEAITMPSGIAVGDLLLCFATVDAPTAGDSIALDAGAASQEWTTLHQSAGPGTNVMRGAVFGKIADGSDTLTLDAAAQDYDAYVVCIKDHGITNISQLVNGASPNLLIPATGTTGNANPPSVDLGRVEGMLWLAVAMVDATTGNTISGVPSGYTALGTTLTSASSTSSVLMQIARLESSSDQSEDPGTFTNTSRNWIAYTVGIPYKPAPQSVTLVAATAATSARALTITPGAVSRSLTTTTIATSARPLTPSTTTPPSGVTLSPATAATSARPLTVTPGAVSRALTTTTVAVSARPLTVTPGAVSVALAPAVAATSARPLGLIYAQTVALATSAVVTSARPLGITPGAVTRALAPASVAVSARPLGVTPGSTTRAVAPASVAVSARPLTPTPGAVSIAAAPVTVATSARPLGVTAGAVTVAAAPAVAAVSARPLGVVAGAVTVALAPAAATVSARPLGVTPGAVSTALAPAVVASSAQALTARTSVPLTPGVVAVQAQPLAISTGAVEIDLAPAAAAVEAQELGVTPGAATIGLAPAAASWTARPLGVTVGPVAVALAPATVSSAARALTIGSVASVELQRVTVASTARPLGVAAGAVQIAVQPAAAAWTAVPLTPTPGAVSVALSPATAALTARPLALDTTTGVDLAPAVVNVEARPLGVVTESTVALAPVEVHSEARQLGVTTGDALVLLEPAVQPVVAIPLLPVPGPVSVALEPAEAAWTPVALGTVSGLFVQLQPAIAVAGARPLVVTAGPVDVDLVAAVLAVLARTLTVQALQPGYHSRRDLDGATGRDLDGRTTSVLDARTARNLDGRSTHPLDGRTIRRK